MLTHRERVLRTLRFQPTDRVPCDLMEGLTWPELEDYIARERGLKGRDAILDHLDVDLRWVYSDYVGPEARPPAEGLPDGWGLTYSDHLYRRPLADAHTESDIERHPWPNPDWWQPPDFAAARGRWPEHALVYLPTWNPLFCGACKAFGMEEALLKMVAEPLVFEAFVRRQHAFYMAILERGLRAASGLCDICWLGDDYASHRAMLMAPDLWRRMIKPLLAEQVRAAREHGLLVLFHSCGAVRPILNDLIDIGVNALLVFQTSAEGMDAPSIAREFGGRLAFYGGIDTQRLLRSGTPDEVRAEVCANIRAFSHCGGYIVADAHRIGDIRGENIEAMCEAAHACHP